MTRSLFCIFSKTNIFFYLKAKLTVSKSLYNKWRYFFDSTHLKGCHFFRVNLQKLAKGWGNSDLPETLTYSGIGAKIYLNTPSNMYGNSTVVERADNLGFPVDGCKQSKLPYNNGCQTKDPV